MSVSPQDSPPIYTEVVSITSVPLLEHPPPPTTAEPSPLYIPTTRPVITDTSRLLIPHEDLAKQRISLTSLGKSSRGKRVNVDIFDDFTGDADGRSRLTSNLSHMSAAQCRICFSGE
ncbi:hypothetical protein RvY_01554 [Ramazzottius varieornatus]|uniref:Uncharacterized protein n=1 Tax=Ramazzottius varieornatus TaxID=947166 RepID=A0A1D1US13_RAMVA|nr:hypothetical protein RvY_01554 [Ramazzottius varieornatus]